MSTRSGGALVGRLLAEFAIIFIGVVLAFQFENWREARVDREREQEAIAALTADFEANARNLDETLEAQNYTMDASRLWLLAVGGSEPGVPADSLAYVWGYAVSWFAEELVSGAWDGLTSSGDVGLLQDAELRSRIAQFYGIVDAGFEDHDNEMDLMFAIQDLTKVPTGPMIAPIGPIAALRTGVALDSSLVAEVIETPGLLGLLVWKRYVSNNRIFRLEALRAQTDTILASLEDARAPR